MKFKPFMAIAAVLAIIFGLGFLLFPTQVMSNYDVTLGEGGQWVARYLGSAFTGIGVLTWLARNAKQSDTLAAIVLGVFFLSVTGRLPGRSLWPGKCTHLVHRRHLPFLDVRVWLFPVYEASKFLTRV